MNSREAAYDEEEQLRRAIEESKEETKINPDDLASRRGKRSRSDSEAYVLALWLAISNEEAPTPVSHPMMVANLLYSYSHDKQVTKRQRTGSPSPTTAAKRSNPASDSGSEDETSLKAVVNGLKRSQRTTVRDQRDKDTKEVDATEAEHADPSGRRKGRSDRRKGEGESGSALNAALPAK